MTQKIFVLLALSFLFAATLLIQFGPPGIKYWFTDRYEIYFSPEFTLPPDATEVLPQDEVIREYKTRGFKLTCYGGLHREEKVNASNDYLCWAFTKQAYNNIPAKMVTFFFSQGALNDVRVEFPESSHPALKDYLLKRLARFPRHHWKKETDIFGERLVSWITPNGIITVSGQATKNQPIILLWNNHKQPKSPPKIQTIEKI